MKITYLFLLISKQNMENIYLECCAPPGGTDGMDSGVNYCSDEEHAKVVVGPVSLQMEDFASGYKEFSVICYL